MIRAIWDISERGGVRVDGEHYRVWGAKRGPEPAHDISIWLGAVKPRMLRLIGRKADGWLPSLAYLIEAIGRRPGARQQHHRRGRAAAGRDPREIRRLVNIRAPSDDAPGFLQGLPEQWVEDLLPLVLEHGFGTFILMGRRSAGDRACSQGRSRRRCARRSRTSGRCRHARRGRWCAAQKRWPAGVRASTTTRSGVASDKSDRAGRQAIRQGPLDLPARPAPGAGDAARERRGGGRGARFARSRTCRYRSAAAGTASAAARPTTAGSSSTSPSSNQIEVLDPESGRIRLGPAPAGATSPGRSPHMGWR